MAWPLHVGPANMMNQTYLAPSRFTNSDQAAIRALAEEITADCTSTSEKAARLYAWVRDQVLYTMGSWNQTASETLELRSGTCSNKANLMVALARSLGIPAGFHVQYVKTSGYFAGAFIPMIRKLVREVSIHVYAALWIDGRWVKCDPSDDRALCESIVRVVPHAAVLDFDGKNDAVIPFPKEAIVSDVGPLPSIDDQFERRSRLPEGMARIFSLLVSYMRDNGARYTSIDDITLARIERDFSGWLALSPDGAQRAS